MSFDKQYPPDRTGLVEQTLPNKTSPNPDLSPQTPHQQGVSDDLDDCTLSGGIRIKQPSKTLITRKNLLLGATCLVLTVLCHRYVRYIHLKDDREQCRAIAKASSQTLSRECVQALLGPLEPPPYHLYTAQDGKFEDFDEILRVWLLSTKDRHIPRLREFLLFGNRTVPDLPLLFYATVILPAHVARVLVPTAIVRYDIRVDSGFLLNVCVCLLCYWAVGITGIWFTATETITQFLQWSHGGQVLINMPQELLLGVGLYDMVVSICGLLLTFRRNSTSQTSDTERSHKSLETVTSARVGMEDVRKPNEAQTDTMTKPSRLGRVLVHGWRAVSCGRLILMTLTFGWRMLPLAVTEMLIQFHLNTHVSALMQKNNTSRLRRLLYITLSAGIFTALSEGDRSLIQRRILRPENIRFLWTRQLYLGKVRLDGRTAFSSEIDLVLGGKGTGATFNSTFFRRWHKDEVVGIDAFPEAWSRLSEFLQGAAGVDPEDYAWIRNEL